MSLDRSLRSRSSLSRHRNVLSRAERIAKLAEEDKWDESQGVLGLPKVANRKLKTSKKKAKTEEAAEGTSTEEESPST